MCKRVFNSFSRGLRVFSSTASTSSKQFETVIGVEVHAQLKTRAKLFSLAPSTFAAAPNSSVAPFDIALPGALPVLNKACVSSAVRAGLGLGGRINSTSRFVRKHYFYCDMPCGYQLTQKEQPLVTGGSLTLSKERVVRIEQVQLEQDSGKNIHDIDTDYTYVDLNRAGLPLIEIVTAPDMRSSNEVSDFVSKLQTLLRHLDVCDGIMAKGSFRCDVNVSVRPIGQVEFGERVEIKNLNSIKSIVKAVSFERERQICLDGCVERETRAFDAATGRTHRLRCKEDLLDYRFMPCANLPLVHITPQLVSNIAATMPSLPEAVAARLHTHKLVEPQFVHIIANDLEATRFFDAMCEAGPHTKAYARWMINELYGRLNIMNLALSSSPVPPACLAQLVNLVEKNEISGRIGKEVLDIRMNDQVNSVDFIVDTNDWRQISDEKALQTLCAKAIDSLPEQQVMAYRLGQWRMLNFITGRVMSMSKGRANPAVVQKLLKQTLA